MEPQTYTLIGGPGDGNVVPTAAVAGLSEGEVGRICTPSEPYKAWLYQRCGSELHFQGSQELVKFFGGPIDGITDTVEQCEKQELMDGDRGMIPILTGPDTPPSGYAWYVRKGRRMEYERMCTEAEIKDIRPPEVLREEPGFRI